MKMIREQVMGKELWRITASPWRQYWLRWINSLTKSNIGELGSFLGHQVKWGANHLDGFKRGLDTFLEEKAINGY